MVTVSVSALTAPLILTAVELMVTVDVNDLIFVDSLVGVDDIVTVSVFARFLAASLARVRVDIVIVSVNAFAMDLATVLATESLTVMV
jgi:hypothetical protein